VLSPQALDPALTFRLTVPDAEASLSPPAMSIRKAGQPAGPCAQQAEITLVIDMHTYSII